MNECGSQQSFLKGLSSTPILAYIRHGHHRDDLAGAWLETPSKDLGCPESGSTWMAKSEAPETHSESIRPFSKGRGILWNIQFDNPGGVFVRTLPSASASCSNLSRFHTRTHTRVCTCMPTDTQCTHVQAHTQTHTFSQNDFWQQQSRIFPIPCN